MTKRKLFCEYGPVFYWISVRKERLKRYASDSVSDLCFCFDRTSSSLPVLQKGHRSMLLRPLLGVDMQLQQNKIHNLSLAAKKIDGVLIHPGECFSFWRMVGPTTARQGYLPGLTIAGGRLGHDSGGGLCQLANMIHWLALHSPLTITEHHHHSDAIFPDENRRVPFGTGTSIFYNNVDYRFINRTPQTLQLRIWLDDIDLCGELRGTQKFDCRYRLIEEDHHFSCEENEYYRNSKVFRLCYTRNNGELLRKELLLKNHSRVLYNPALIPKDEIREGLYVL